MNINNNIPFRIFRTFITFIRTFAVEWLKKIEFKGTLMQV